jgi:hypothetical protein
MKATQTGLRKKCDPAYFFSIVLPAITAVSPLEKAGPPFGWLTGRKKLKKRRKSSITKY